MKPLMKFSFLVRFYQWGMLLLTMLASGSVMAAQCSAVFPGAVQSHGNGGTLTINSNGTILNSPVTQLPFDNGTINGNGTSCVSADCSVTGNNAASFSLPAFPSDAVLSGGSYSFNSNRTLGQGSYNSDSFSFINVNNGRVNFSSNYSTYYIRGLTINNNGRANLRPGTYYIKTLNLNGDARINVVGTGHVKIYAQDVSLSSNAIIDGSRNSARLLMTVYNNMHVNSNSQAEGVFYVGNTLTVDSNGYVSGAVSALNLTLNSNGTVNYDSALVNQTDFGGLCTIGPVNTTIAKFQMEQTGWSGSGSILDTSGNNNNGTPVGSVSPVLPSPQKSCKAASIPANTSHNARSAINTDVDMNTLGDQGSIAFWYRSNQNWDQVGTSKVLLDATQSNDSEFTLFHSQSQRLFLYISESDNDTAVYSTNSTFNFTSSDWVHIAVTWDADNNDVKIYVNGSSQSLNEQAGVALDEGLANIGILYIGDNRSTSQITETGYSADGLIDEVQMFNYELSATQVNTASNDVTTCAPPPPVLLAKYELSEDSWSGNNSILDTSGNSNHASPVGSISSVLPSPQISCRAADIPANASSSSSAVNTGLDLDNDIGSDGTIAFWYKSDTNWSGGVNRKLIDASTYSGNVLTSKAFYGTLTSTGRIEFGLEGNNDNDHVVQTSAQSFSAQEWVHIAFTWDATTQTLQIYLNGQLQNLSTVVNQGISAPLSGMDTLYIGDNRTSYDSFENNTNNSAAGEIDEIHIYDGVVNSTTINTVMNNTTRCLVPDIFYTFDECSYNDNPFEIKDASANQDATPFSSIDTQDDAQVGRSVKLDAFNHYAETNVQLNSSWSVSTWFKKPLTIDSGSRYHVLGSFAGSKDLLVLDNQNNFRWEMYDNTTTTGTYQFGNLSDGWHHLALVAHNGSTKLYIDGTLVDTVAKHPTGQLTHLGTSTDSLGTSAAQGWRAPLDEFLLFKSEISAADINSIYQNQLAGKNYDGTTRAMPNCFCTINGLNGKYYAGYNNSGDAFPTGTPTLTRLDSNVAFNWNTGGPGSGVGSNDFAVSWQGTVQAPVSGPVTFSTYTDDGVRLWVNGQLLVDDWRDKSINRVVAPAITLVKDEFYSIRMEYYENSGFAQAELEWQYSGQSRQRIPNQYLFACDGPIATQVSLQCNQQDKFTVNFDVIGSGTISNSELQDLSHYVLKTNGGTSVPLSSASVTGTNQVEITTSSNLVMEGQYVLTINDLKDSNNNKISPDPTNLSFTAAPMGLTGYYYDNYNQLNPFPADVPELTRVDQNVDFNWGSGSPGAGVSSNQFAVAWVGEVIAPVSGPITFSTYTDDGARLWVNGVQIIDDWTLHSATRTTASAVTLSAGQKYSIRMEYFEGPGSALARLEWQYSGQGVQAIPRTYLRPQCTQPGTLDHYRLIHPDQGYTCTTTPVEVKACADAGCTALFTDTAVSMNLTTTNGTWVGGASLSFTGSTTKSLQNLVAESTSQIGATSLNPNAMVKCYIGGTLSDCNIDYDAVGLSVSWAANTDPVIDIPTQTSQSPFASKLIIKPANAACNADIQNNKLEIAVQCETPGSCNTNQFVVNGSATGDPTVFHTLNTVAFNASGVAEVNANFLRYDDAGAIKIKVRDSENKASGESNQFVVKPTELKLSHTANVPEAAGANFNLLVTAVGALNNPTPNYQSQQLQMSVQKNSPTTPVALDSTYRSKLNVSYNKLSGGQESFETNPELNLNFPGTSLFVNQPDFTNGVATLVSRHSEVGVISFDFKDNNYMGQGSIEASHGSLRFAPAYFDNITNITVATCGSSNVHYVGQSLNQDTTITLAARNVQGDKTRYYDSQGSTGSAFRFTGTSLFPNRMYKDENDTVITQGTLPVISNGTALSETGDFTGDFEIRFNGDQYALPKGTTDLRPQTTPVNVGTPDTTYAYRFEIPAANFTAAEADDIGLRSGATGPWQPLVKQNITDGIELRYGRVRLENVFGTNNVPLPVPFVLEYFNGSGNWVVNGQDSCTTYNTSELVVVTAAGSGVTVENNGIRTVVEGQPITPDAGFVLLPNGTDQTIRVEWQSPPVHLQYDWDDNNSLDDPGANATFGQFRGNDRIIHWREVFND